MIELKITVTENLVKSFGQAALERQVENFLQHLMLKKAAEDILIELNMEDDLMNDPKWQTAKELAWAAAKENYLPQESRPK